MKRILLSISAIMFAGTSMAQWPNNSLLPTGNTFFGTQFNAPINIFTNGIFRAQFTTGNSLNSWNGNAGDGLKILAPPNSTGDLSLFTSNSPIFGGNETHAVFGGSGQVSGQNNRFEFISTGANMGNYYSTFSATGIHRFDRGTTEQGRLGTNNNWRFGANTSGPVFGGLNAARKVEVVDNNVQFRLTYSANASGPNTDFFSNQQGNLQIMPSGQRVGINLNANPTANLDINGNARIRNVQTGTPNSILVGVNANGSSDVNVRRLDFNGNPNTFLSGNGTFQTVNTTTPSANNGVSRQMPLLNPNPAYQLGDLYQPNTPFVNTNTPLTANRQVRLNGRNFIFSGAGNVGIGLSYPVMPTEVLDVNGNARLRNVPTQGGQSLILGLQNGTNANDVELSRLNFTGNTNQVLLGNGTWGTITGGIGNACGATPNPLTNDYQIPMNDKNIFFTDNNLLGQNSVAIGVSCGTALSGKLDVYQSHPAPVGINTFGIVGLNDDVATMPGLEYTGNMVMLMVFKPAIRL